MSFVREQQTLENERKAKEEERKAKEEERLDKVRLFEIERGKLELKRGEQASMEKEKARQENNNNNDCLTAFDPGQPG